MSANPVSDSNGYEVYTGTWTNWSRGPVFGATLTLSREDANLLIAFVAFFVAVVGTRFWRIACLALHFIYSTQDPRDGLHHQRQAILRNTPNPEAGLFIILDLALAWRRSAKRLWRRLLPLLTLSATCLCGFTIASGFSSKVSTTTGSEVLISSSLCGYLDFEGDMNITLAESLYYPAMAKQIAASDNYAQQCYTSSTTGVLSCGTFVQKQLPTSVITNASCPFNGSICRSNTSNLILDTGYLDSHNDLGLNAPPSERFLFRRLISCAPLVTEGYKTQFNLSNDRSYTRYYYGECLEGPNSDPSSNYSYEYSNDAIYEAKATNSSLTHEDYSIG